MTINNEKAFEVYIRSLIESRITSINKNIYALSNKKAVDIIICRDGAKPALFFLEVKFHQASHGRLGFGSNKGKGFQPEILSRGPSYLESNLRWVISSESHIESGLLFLPSSQIRQYISGGSIGEKFNNIQTRIFQEHPLSSEEEFISDLGKWLGASA